MDVFAARKQDSFTWPDVTVLGIYSALVAWLVDHHEPWTDEAQAWLIARDSSLWEIFRTRLHYEGTPGLWHLLLWSFVRLHISYVGMHWAVALIAITSIYIFLRYSPFPLHLRAIIPFSFALVFQTAIIARSYSLVPLLSFLICTLLTGHRRRPVTLAILIGLLANTSLIAFVFALGLIPLAIIHQSQAEPGHSKLSRAGSFAIVIVMMGCACYTAVPAPDISFNKGARIAVNRPIQKLFSQITAIPIPTAVPEASPILAAPTIIEPKHSIPAIILSSIGKLVLIAFFTVSDFKILALAFYFLLARQLYSCRIWTTALPLIAVLIGGTLLGIADHHLSVVTTALLSTLWLGWNRISQPSSRARIGSKLFHLVLIAVFLEHAAWTVYAGIYDTYSPFDGGLAAANYLLPLKAGTKIGAIGFGTISIEPYAASPLFFNLPTSYWPFRKAVDADTSANIVWTVSQSPHFIVVVEGFSRNLGIGDRLGRPTESWVRSDLRDTPAYLRRNGYRETHRFCGLEPSHFSFDRGMCLVLYEAPESKHPQNSALLPH